MPDLKIEAINTDQAFNNAIEYLLIEYKNDLGAFIDKFICIDQGKRLE